MNDYLKMFYLPQMQTPLAIFFLLIGMNIGSFLNVCIFRIPIKKSIVFPPSACMNCGKVIKWYENIPVLSYLFLGGKCSNCKTKLSIQYPLIELLNGILYLFLFLYFGLTIETFLLMFFVSSMIVISLIDIKTQDVYLKTVLPVIIAGPIYGYFSSNLSWQLSLIGIIAGASSLLLVIALFFIVTKKIGMGFGDVYILAAIGGFIGPQKLPAALFIASTSGVIFYIIMKILFKNKRIATNLKKEDINTENEADLDHALYFGPFLALSGIILIFFDPMSYLV